MEIGPGSRYTLYRSLRSAYSIAGLALPTGTGNCFAANYDECQLAHYAASSKAPPVKSSTPVVLAWVIVKERDPNEQAGVVIFWLYYFRPVKEAMARSAQVDVYVTMIRSTVRTQVERRLSEHPNPQFGLAGEEKSPSRGDGLCCTAKSFELIACLYRFPAKCAKASSRRAPF